MIKLFNITKDYKVADKFVKALKGVSVTFRNAEFVSILGPSGCGKTTLLNIVGGLDHYTSGDLVIDNISTKNFKDRDWDTYRNHRVGFIFQSYNLIPHQTVLENVELALNIAGYKKVERVKKAKQALDRVGLTDQYYKKPNQLSGGQCQRVAIARALVNDPEILLADEPTGALDTETSVQIMDLIKEIAKDTLVVMVTHNPELAEKYSTRIIKLLDGNIIADSNPYLVEDIEDKIEQPVKTKKSKLGFWSAFNLSARNLWSKLKRTVMVCFAGSIGIIGVASVLAVSTGIHNYIDNMQNDMLSGNPITIQETSFDLSGLLNASNFQIQANALNNSVEDGYINIDKVIDEIVEMSNKVDDLRIQNDINQDYISYLQNMPKEYYSAFNFDYGINLANNIYTKSPFTNQSDKVISLTALKEICTAILKQTDVKEYASLITSLTDVFMQLPSSQDFILKQYDILREDGTMLYPQAKNEIAIVVNNQNELSDLMLAQLGYYTQEEFINCIYKANNDPKYNPALDKDKISYEDLLGQTFTWYPNNSVYTKTQNNMQSPFLYNPYVTEDFTGGIDLTITAILRPKQGLNYGSLQTGFYYTSNFTNDVLQNSLTSTIVQYLKNLGQESFTSGEFITDSGSLQLGIKYTYNFEFEGTQYTDQVGFVGSQNMLSSLMGSSSGAAVPNYYTLTLRELGGETLPSKISIYPVDFEIKDKLTAYLDKWNEDGDIVISETKTLTKDERSDIKYNDNLALIIDMISGMIDIVTTALVAFTALSLVVSTVMIAIITYVSVIERIKEIGVIRSLGGRKKDVSRLFIAESGIIGGVAGLIGVIITYGITLLINTLANMQIATLTIVIAVTMIAISILLTLISGLIPAKAASKKDPVVALRSE